MGWRQGEGIGPGRDESSRPADVSLGSLGARKASKWGRVAGVAAENTPVYLPPAKTDVHGLGFDPFKVREQYSVLTVLQLASHMVSSVQCTKMLGSRLEPALPWLQQSSVSCRKQAGQRQQCMAWQQPWCTSLLP